MIREVGEECLYWRRCSFEGGWGPVKEEFPFPSWPEAAPRSHDLVEFLSQVTSSIPFGLMTSKDWLRERNNSQCHSCVEHKRQTRRKQVNRRILKKTTLTWWQIQRYTDLSKGNQKRSWKENWAADSNRGNLQFWVLRGCVVHRSRNVWQCT